MRESDLLPPSSKGSASRCPCASFQRSASTVLPSGRWARQSARYTLPLKSAPMPFEVSAKRRSSWPWLGPSESHWRRRESNPPTSPTTRSFCTRDVPTPRSWKCSTSSAAPKPQYQRRLSARLRHSDTHCACSLVLYAVILVLEPSRSLPLTVRVRSSVTPCL